jgi:hypothetical protein
MKKLAGISKYAILMSGDNKVICLCYPNSHIANLIANTNSTKLIFMIVESMVIDW